MNLTVIGNCQHKLTNKPKCQYFEFDRAGLGNRYLISQVQKITANWDFLLRGWPLICTVVGESTGEVTIYSELWTLHLLLCKSGGPTPKGEYLQAVHLRGGAKPSVVTKEAVSSQLRAQSWLHHQLAWQVCKKEVKETGHGWILFYISAENFLDYPGSDPTFMSRFKAKSQQRTFLTIRAVIPLSSQNSKLSLTREYFYLAMLWSCSNDPSCWHSNLQRSTMFCWPAQIRFLSTTQLNCLQILVSWWS